MHDLYVTQTSLPPFEEYCAEIRSLWDTHVLTNCGEKHELLESQLAGYLGVEHLALVSNGHAALEASLQALELGSDGRDEVITTPYTFASTVHAVVRSGLKPVFADVRPRDLTIDPESVRRLVGPRTCAVLGVHVYGNVCDVDALAGVAAERDLKVVYDAAHAFGVRRDGVPVGRYGDASTFSFHATKVFSTAEGGAVACSDAALRERIALWRNFGIEGPEVVSFVGGNAKMSELSAAMGICNLRHVGSCIARRGEVVRVYEDLLSDVEGLSLCDRPGNVEPNYSYLPVFIDEGAFGRSRDELFEFLAQRGIHARKYFYPLLTDCACYAGRFGSESTPVARRAASRVLCLPLSAEMAEDDARSVAQAVLAAHRRAGRA